jgi:exosortase C (VPDSG-CTERM-specific)
VSDKSPRPHGGHGLHWHTGCDSRPSRMITASIVLTAAFALPLARLMAFAASSDLHSHVLLVPAVSAYLLRDRWRRLPQPGASHGMLAAVCGLAGAVALVLACSATLGPDNTHSLFALSYVSLLAACGYYFMGAEWMRAAAFPFAFLLFLVPLPDGAVDWLERASVVGSTDATEIYYRIFGTPYLRRDVIFELPTITLRVAQECSGIRSSWVLFITSILAANMFLRTTWRRIALVAFVIPLAILRNGFRIFVLSELCIRIGPHMIDSVIHHRGGPIFFALSLIPLFGLLWWLRRGELHTHPRPA